MQADDWERPGAGALAVRLVPGGNVGGAAVLILINAAARACTFNLAECHPLPAGTCWLPQLCSDSLHGHPAVPLPWGDAVEVPARSLWLAKATPMP